MLTISDALSVSKLTSPGQNGTNYHCHPQRVRKMHFWAPRACWESLNAEKGKSETQFWNGDLRQVGLPLVCVSTFFNWEYQIYIRLLLLIDWHAESLFLAWHTERCGVSRRVEETSDADSRERIGSSGTNFAPFWLNFSPGCSLTLYQRCAGHIGQQYIATRVSEAPLIFMVVAVEKWRRKITKILTPTSARP